MDAALAATLKEAFALLAAGVGDPASPFRTPTLASVTETGGPDQRTVVLRAFDPVARRLELHSDSRAEKCPQLRARQSVALHVWDSGRRLQIRILGEAALHVGDEVAQRAWEALSPLGHQLYRTRQAPGTPIADPSRVDEVPEDEGYTVFAVIEVAFHRVETLRLEGHGQRRARFEWGDVGQTAEWLVP